MSDSNKRSSFPSIERLLASDPKAAAPINDLSFPSEEAAVLTGIGASTIRTYRRNILTSEPREFDASTLKASKILTFDIETVPATVWKYDLRPSWISHKNVLAPGEMLSWAAGWYHEPGQIHYMDQVRHGGYEEMLQGLWRLLDEASYVVGWNSDRFDLKKVRGYFARIGLPPFRPPKSIDLMKTARTLGFESSSLDYTARMMGVRRKGDGGVLADWQKCLAGDEEALALLEEYNGGDVLTTVELFDALRPWIPNHPHMGFASDDRQRCPRCGSDDLTDVGVVQAERIRYRLHRCGNCTGLTRSTAHSRASMTKAA